MTPPTHREIWAEELRRVGLGMWADILLAGHELDRTDQAALAAMARVAPGWTKGKPPSQDEEPRRVIWTGEDGSCYWMPLPPLPEGENP
jgi:hypothetical protein